MSDAETRTQLQSIIDKHAGDPTELLAILKDAQALWRLVTPEIVTLLAEVLDLPRVHVEGTATFYHFLSGSRGNARSLARAALPRSRSAR